MNSRKRCHSVDVSLPCFSQVGDIVTGLETVDEEWFLGDLRGRRALLPRNYVQILG